MPKKRVHAIAVILPVVFPGRTAPAPEALEAMGIPSAMVIDWLAALAYYERTLPTLVEARCN